MLVTYLVELQMKIDAEGHGKVRAVLLAPSDVSDLVRVKIEDAALRKQRVEHIDLSMGSVIVQIHADDQVKVKK